MKRSVGVVINRCREYGFLFTELVKRDFKKRYKRTALGMLWSVLGPLLQLCVMALVFTNFFGRTTPHYIVYLFAGNLTYSFFRESTNTGMTSLIGNAALIQKVKVPKYIFLLAANIKSLINFLINLIIFFIFVIFDDIPLGAHLFFLIIPILNLVAFNIGVGLILSAMFVFFRDTSYLYDIFTQLLMYMSAIFYPVDGFSYRVRQLFMLNPVFTHIFYIRSIVIHAVIPSLNVHIIMFTSSAIVLLVGSLIYKKNNYRFIYYF